MRRTSETNVHVPAKIELSNTKDFNSYNFPIGKDPETKSQKSMNNLNQSTNKALTKHKLKLSLLELFNQWDTNNDEVLTTLEIIYGLRVAGFVLDAESLKQAIATVANRSKDKLWGADDLSYSHHFLDNEGFILVMLYVMKVDLPEINVLLEKNNLKSEMQPAKGLEIVELFRKTLASDPTLGQRMQELRTKQTALIASARDGSHIDTVAWNNTVKEVSLQRSKSKRQSQQLKMEVIQFENADYPSCIKLNKLLSSAYTLPTCAVFFWLLIPTVLYIFVNQWGFNEAFYYSVQSGLSVGFGSLSEEKVTGKNTFDVCSSGTNVTELLELVVAQQHLHGTTNGELCAYQYVPNNLYLVSMFYTIIHVCLGASLIGGVLSLFTVMAVESSESWFDEGKEKAIQEQKIQAFHLSKRKSMNRMNQAVDVESKVDAMDVKISKIEQHGK